LADLIRIPTKTTGLKAGDKLVEQFEVVFTCDIFCNVVDNYGDIGVSWRLARQLANEFGLEVRLWVDDLASFAKLCPLVVAGLAKQRCYGVEVQRWTKSFPDVEAANLVIDAFGCTLPDSYLAAMAVKLPVWINLEYLSAEDWVEACHCLPSPRPPLTRYFFFPGFTRKTGGLLLERDLLARREAFLCDPGRQLAFWQSIQVVMPALDTLKVSLFCYENEALDGLFDVWANGEQRVLCLVPTGRILTQVRQYFDDASSHHPRRTFGYEYGNLSVCVLPFVAQERYDELLWACDVNFVRGEDSFVRAQWAGKPFVWQIYPQHDDVHTKKLQAFLDLYDVQLTPLTSHALQGLWQVWNADAGFAKAINFERVWYAFDAARKELNQHGQVWAHELSENNLALNLLDFFQKIGRMRAFEIDEQRT
jgi:uncharacterized repeat protein (TIGR03837 family)